MSVPRNLADLLDEYPPDVRQLALALRETVTSILPETNEMVDHEARVIGCGLGDGHRDLICTIILSQKGVKLGMVNGATLADPARLLEGSGKRHRHVPLRHVDDANRPELVSLLEAGMSAWRRGR
jgi:hypothetical protein